MKVNIMVKKFLTAFCIAGALASNMAFAKEEPVREISRVNMASAFEQTDMPMQLAVLSSEEMNETQGAWVWIPLYYAPTIGAYTLTLYQTSAYLPLYHAGHGIANLFRNR